MQIQITNEERAVFNFLKDTAATKAPEYLAKNQIVYSSLRAESPALGTQQNIPFSINENDTSTPSTSTEIRLKQNDTFVVTKWGLFIANFTGSRSSMRLRTYPNQRIFSAAGEAAAMQAIYNSVLNVMVDNQLYYPQFSTDIFLKVPNFQELMANVTALPAGYTAAGVDKDQYESEMAMVDCVPTLALYGGRDNVVNVVMPDSVNMTPAGGTNVCVFIARGFLMPNWSTALSNRPL